MSTRGLVGFKLDGELYGVFNHYDSYFSNLGEHVVNQIKQFIFEQDIPTLKNNLVSINWIDDDNTNETITDVSACDLIELITCTKVLGLVSANKNIRKLFESNQTLTICNEKDFYKDTLFCEWAYIIDLDSKSLDIRNGDTYTFPLFDLDVNTIKKALQ